MSEPAKKYVRLARRYPELMLFPTDKNRKRALRDLTAALFQGRSLLLRVGIVALLVILLGSTSLTWLSWIGGAPASMACGALAGYTFVFVLGWSSPRWRHRFLRQRLIDMGIPICVACGYDLRGQTLPRCPECGRVFDTTLLPAPDPPADSHADTPP